MQSVLAAVTAGLYAVSAVGYAANFQRRTALRAQAGTWALAVGFLAHSLLLGQAALHLDGVPLTNQVLPSLCAWLVVIVYAYLEWTAGDRALGALVMPIVTLLHLLALPGLLGPIAPLEYTGGWFQLHVLAYIGAYASFAISCVSAIMYVMLLGEIQHKHLGYFYERLPPLGVLDQVNNKAATFGFGLLSAGVVASTVWAHEAMDRLWVWDDVRLIPLLLAWVIYGGHVAARFLSGWQGRRAALLSIAGFTVVILTFPVVGVFFSGVHPFGR
jgi:ABC-type uncharacterized transport system permease subunit